MVIRVVRNCIAAKVVTRDFRENLDFEVVGTGLGYGVDITSRETTVVNIKRCQFNRNLLNSVERERHATDGGVTAVIQAESISLANTIKCDVIELRVLASTVQTKAIFIVVDHQAWVDAIDIRDIATKRDRTFEIVNRERC